MTNGDGDQRMAIDIRELKGAQSVQTQYNPPFDEGNIYQIMMRFSAAGQAMPPWGSPSRDVELRKFFYAEGNDLLQGAAGTLIKKSRAVPFTISGPERQVYRLQNTITNDSDMGKGWLHFLAKMLIDFTSQDKGAFAEIIRDRSGRVVSIAHMDAARCYATNNPEYPVIYLDQKGVYHRMAEDAVMRIVDMPSPIEGGAASNIGFCALSRVVKSARVMQMLSTYKEEKLDSRPSPGIMMVRGMTIKQVSEALKEADEKDVQEHGRLLYRGIPILASLSADYEAGLDFVEFRSMPEALTFTDETNLFVHILALSYGLDVRDLGWSGTDTGDTKADAMVQAMKARGKGMGEILQLFEFGMNNLVMPTSCEFLFDFQDDEEDQIQTEIRSAKVAMIRQMWEPNQVTMTGLITDAEAHNLLVDEGILPEEFRVEDLTDTETVTPTSPEEVEGEQSAALPEPEAVPMEAAV